MAEKSATRCAFKFAANGFPVNDHNDLASELSRQPSFAM